MEITPVVSGSVQSRVGNSNGDKLGVGPYIYRGMKTGLLVTIPVLKDPRDALGDQRPFQ